MIFRDLINLLALWKVLFSWAPIILWLQDPFRTTKDGCSPSALGYGCGPPHSKWPIINFSEEGQPRPFEESSQLFYFVVRVISLVSFFFFDSLCCYQRLCSVNSSFIIPTICWTLFGKAHWEIHPTFVKKGLLIQMPCPSSHFPSCCHHATMLYKCNTKQLIIVPLHVFIKLKWFLLMHFLDWNKLVK